MLIGRQVGTIPIIECLHTILNNDSVKYLFNFRSDDLIFKFIHFQIFNLQLFIRFIVSIVVVYRVLPQLNFNAFNC